MRSRSRGGLVLGVLAVVLAVWPFGAGADDLPFETPFRVDAESLEYIPEGGVYVGSGGVLLEQDRRRLSADWLAFSLETGRGVASGRVRFRDDEQYLEGSFVIFD